MIYVRNLALFYSEHEVAAKNICIFCYRNIVTIVLNSYKEHVNRLMRCRAVATAFTSADNWCAGARNRPRPLFTDHYDQPRLITYRIIRD